MRLFFSSIPSSQTVRRHGIKTVVDSSVLAIKIQRRKKNSFVDSCLIRDSYNCVYRELSMQTILEGRKILNILRYIKSRICFRRWMLIWEDFGILLSLMMEYPIPKLDFQSMKEKSRITS
ncbi:uncharacterized protein LOC102655924 [Apis mellifera]|uniref:Uncharacterized protein LOC102655924 n=1 Tax=Apis mellifera TaxID=7460 RepID=A0A7M7H0W9_APIME|nr:uncharacterized protein LOC102655924 [Apis mellifera]|eukprot:XP_006566234.2 uncharacterized protein LOC102655924 [Apis mellifera]